MAKKYKIKRNQKIYGRSPHRSSIIKWVCVVLICALVAFIGYSIAPVVIDFFSGNFNPPSSSDSSSASQTGDNSSSSGSQQQTAGSLESIAAASLSELAANPDSLAAALKEQSRTAALFTVKGEDGILRYTTASAEAVAAEAVSGDALNLSGAAKKLSTGGVLPIAGLSAFRDPQGAKKMTDACVKYQNGGVATETMWLDNYANQGGKPWFNPYSQRARNYIASLAGELADLGFEAVLLDHLQFPDGVGLHYASYPGSTGGDKSDALYAASQAVKSTLQGKNCQLIISVPVLAGLGQKADQYGSTPFKLDADYILLDMTGAMLQTRYAVGSEVIDLSADRAAGLTRLVALLKENAGTQGFTGKLMVKLDAADTELADIVKAAGINSLLYS